MFDKYKNIILIFTGHDPSIKKNITLESLLKSFLLDYDLECDLLCEITETNFKNHTKLINELEERGFKIDKAYLLGIIKEENYEERENPTGSITIT